MSDVEPTDEICSGRQLPGSQPGKDVSVSFILKAC